MTVISVAYRDDIDDNMQFAQSVTLTVSIPVVDQANHVHTISATVTVTGNTGQTRTTVANTLKNKLQEAANQVNSDVDISAHGETVLLNPTGDTGGTVTDPNTSNGLTNRPDLHSFSIPLTS